MPFLCVLIGQGSLLIACAEHLLRRGHRINGVVSDCPEVGAWSQKTGAMLIAPNEDLVDLFGRQPFDYLFSIVNHAITPAEVLALPRRGAINYHDSALPAYSGFNATAWALLDGQTEHGITWHRMTTDVDAGAVLMQTQLPIGEDDTAFSLATRASESAARFFAELLTLLENGQPAETPARPAQNFHLKSERPGFPVLDWDRPVQDLLRLIRALDFGSADNWMTRAKLRTPSGDFICVGHATRLAPLHAAPGTLGLVSANGIEVSAIDGAVLLAELTTLEGDALDVARLRALGLVSGAVLPPSRPEAIEAVRVLDREVTRTERYWLRKLERLSAPAPGELKVHAAAGTIERMAMPLPKGYAELAPALQRSSLAAGLAVYLARIGDGDGAGRVDLGLCFDHPVHEVRALYASVVPLSFEVSPHTTWAELVRRAEQEIAGSWQRKTHARDIWTRYASLRGKEPAARNLPLGLAFDDDPDAEPTLPDAVRLLLRLPAEAQVLELVFDSSAIGRHHVERLAARLVNLVESARQAPQTAISKLSIVTPHEREQLLDTFQDTARPDVETDCVHRLFASRVARHPNKTAIVFRDVSLTYRELDERANALAHCLRGLGVGPDQLVAIAVERSLHMVVGLLAILKAGGAYVPLDPAYPAERLAIMLEDSRARWLLTQSHLAPRLPHHGADVVLVDGPLDPQTSPSPPASAVDAGHLAYVIFTSGSTGRPKGVMVEHRNVANFFAGMDERVGTEPGVWLAVTSISFDISVLEILWTLTRGFEVVIQEEGDRASLLKSQSRVRASSRPMGFGLFYFAADSANAAATNAYRLLLDGARFADTHDFVAVWTPERHFHAFGGLYPNAAITSAAIASITSKVELRAGSVVIPLHDPIRVAEEWAVVDNLSQGRVGLSFASGWHANDFALKPENYERRREIMQESIDTVLRLWAGEKIKVKNGVGEEIEVSVLPRPVRERPPMWIASAGNVETFRAAGRSGYNVLTNMLGQDIKDLADKFAAYRQARRECGHAGDGVISVMLHTFVTNDDDRARELAREPFSNYLKSSYDLVKVAPWMFPAFKQPSLAGADSSAFDPSRFDDSDMAALLDHAFERYFDTAGLFGTPERALRLVEQLKDIGATEVACLIDFGIDPDTVLENLEHLDALRRLANPGPSIALEPPSPLTVREQFERRAITHFQCTPSMARMLVADGTIAAMGSLRKFLVGGEALPVDLAQTLTSELAHTDLINMYGPTETTVWSTTAAIGRSGEPITIGRPIANTQIRILDPGFELAPLGTPGELCIGGAGVVRGYLHRPDLTAQRFIADPFVPGNRLYRTGDLARYRDDGAIEYIGRIDQQVKVNGYRIELGEIETILGRHPAVKESVVAVKAGPVGVELVGYVIATGPSAQPEAHAAVSDWKERWDAAYAKHSTPGQAPARFNTAGWLSSYTGEPIPTDQMREWLDLTAQRILELRPRRVLEIGCGTGMILYACLPHVEHYTAVDISPFALERIRAELTAQERQKVTLLNQPAHELEGVQDHGYDLVIINSVAQYFPHAQYLTQVLTRASRALVDGGKIFLGDIRSLEEAHSFHAEVELQQAPGQITAAALGQRIAERAALESELLLAAGFFDELERTVPQLGLVSIRLKRGASANEMRDFRSDVVLQSGPRKPRLDFSPASILDAPDSLAPVLAHLADRPPLLLVQGIRNARLDRIHDLASRLGEGAKDTTVETLRRNLAEPARGVDPNALLDLDPEYDVEARFGRQAGTFDALFRHRRTAPPGTWGAPPSAGAPVASVPRVRLETQGLVAKLKAHIQQFLPAYMVPQAFVLMSAFPLTPNGKIDRNALPLPAAQPRQAAVEYAMPSNELEATIADIWRAMLGLERVGRKDNIFDLGASSLLAVEANNRLQNALGHKVPLVTMFRYPTIESLASHLGKMMAQDSPQGSLPAPPSAAEQDRQSRLAAAAERRRRARALNN